MVSSASVEIFRWPASSVINWWICSWNESISKHLKTPLKEKDAKLFLWSPVAVFVFITHPRNLIFPTDTYFFTSAFCINNTNYTVWLRRQMRPIYSINKYFLPTFSFLLSNPVIIVIIFDDSSFLSLTFVSRGAAVIYLFQVWRWWSCPEYRVSSSFTVDRSAF